MKRKIQTVSEVDYILEEFFKKQQPFDDHKLASLLLQAELLFKGYEITPIDWDKKAEEIE